MNDNIKIIQVCSKSKNYDILIGNSIISQIDRKRDILLKERFAIIVNSNVYRLYENYIKNLIQGYDKYDIILMPDGEENKNYKYAEEFLNRLLKKGYTRKSVIIAIGGGVVGDFSGFIAAIYMRGIPVIHIPTTLLAMVDSSIGGKVAVNISTGKNIVGAFHQPELVISDIFFLRTLPENEFKNGLVETVKHALIGENELNNILLENDLESIGELEKIQQVVFLSAGFKSRVVERDEREGGLRAILNFGHTVGHAIESLMEYRGISHGEAVAIGLRIEMEISRRVGWISKDEMDLVDEIMRRYQLLFNEYTLHADSIIKHMKYDKKNVGGKTNFVLLKGLGNPVYNQSVEESLIKDAIQGI